MKTFNAGANDERTAWIAKIKRAIKVAETTESRMILGGLKAWGDARAKRCAKTGGIGRK